MSSFENYFVRSLGDPERLRFSDKNISGRGNKQVLINPMARDPWGSVYPKSTFFQEDTSQEIIVDADVVHPRRTNRCGLSKTWIIIIISILYLAIIGALVVLLVFLPRHSTWYPIEDLDKLHGPVINKNSYANSSIPIQTIPQYDELIPTSRVNSSVILNTEFANYPPPKMPEHSNIHTSYSKNKLVIRPSPEDPLYSWRDKIIPRADVHGSPFFEYAAPIQTTSHNKLKHTLISSTLKTLETRLPSVVILTEEPRTRINNRILKMQ